MSLIYINVTIGKSCGKKYDLKNYYCSFVLSLILSVKLFENVPSL